MEKDEEGGKRGKQEKEIASQIISERILKISTWIRIQSQSPKKIIIRIRSTLLLTAVSFRPT